MSICRWLPSRGNIIFTLLVAVSLLIANRAGALTLAAPSVASTATIPYQGRLTNTDGTPRNGLTNMEFRLYNVPSGGTALWTEFWTGGNAVLVSDGMFSILLGSLNNTLSSVVQANSQLWLGITVNTDAEMSPRVQLGSAAYALQALTVPDGSIGTVQLADKSVTATKIDLSNARLSVDSIPNYNSVGLLQWQPIPGLSLTAPDNGIYLVLAHVKLVSPAADTVRYSVCLSINGVEIPRTSSTNGGGANEESTVSIAHDIALNTGDTVKVEILSNSAGSQLVLGSWTGMSMIRLSNK